MKILYIISLTINLLLLVLGIYLAFNGRALVRDYVLKNIIDVRHQQKLSMFRAAPVNKGAIIFLGNSITEGGNWDELFPGKNILNRGIGGDITEGVLKRLDEVTRHQPSKLFICIGTNDIARGVAHATTMQNYRAILQQVQTNSPETKIYVQSILPVGKDVILGHNNEKIIPINNELKELCRSMQLTYIDLYPQFTDEAGYLKAAYTNDKLHLLGSGYLAWKELIEVYVNE